jgi:hypothetical protein
MLLQLNGNPFFIASRGKQTPDVSVPETKLGG